MLNVLFVCSKNQWRSPTAEQIYRRHPEISVRSAGTASAAGRQIKADDLDWADLVFVMEQKHKQRITANYSRLAQHKPIHVLDIPDDYQLMDPELVQMIQDSVEPILAEALA